MASAANEGSGVGREMQPIAVWDLPTRVFHWGLVVAFSGAYLTGESDRWGELHAVLGYAVLVLIAFRLIWGLIGSRYARFSSFVAGPAAALRYLGSLSIGRPEHHVGHNPAGGIAILLLLGLGLLVGAAGLATLNGLGGEWFEDIHEAFAQLMLMVVGIHLAGVLVASLAHRENLVRAMLSGRKLGRPEQSIGSTHRPVGLLLLAGLVGLAGLWAAGRTQDLPGLGPAAAPSEDRRDAQMDDGDGSRRGRQRPRHDRDDD